MVIWGRDTPWRQGHILPDQAMKAAGLLTETLTDEVAIVVSHDCDLAQDADAEPMVEVIVGRRITTADGNFTYAKNARHLNITFSAGTESLTADFEASRKSEVAKHQLAAYEPLASVRLSPSERNILQRWLAARYRRSAFPDEFDRRLGSTGVRDHIVKALKSSASTIAAVFFDVDQGEEILRVTSSEPYALAIYLLYSTENDPDAAKQAAESAKQGIVKAFREKCFSEETEAWHDIELIECEVISDQAMTVQQAESLKRWSADHISLRTDPAQTMLRDE